MEKSGFLKWQLGEDPNLVMMYVCAILCGPLLLFYMHALRNEVVKVNPNADDSMHWFSVIIPIAGLAITSAQIVEMEKAKGIEGKYTVPYWEWISVLLGFVFPFIAPLIIADQMKRLNALAA